jgi:hypothetical protein
MFKSRGGPLRLLKSLRGDGTLMWGRNAHRAVSYCIDLYGQGAFLSGDGDIRGDLADLVGKAPANLRLRTAGGEDFRLVFHDVGANMASVELLSPVYSPS